GLVSPFRFFKTTFFYKRFSAHTKIFAFTLAEVLITLTIIGVVAAITIPSVMSNNRNRILYTQLKTTYSDLNTASRQFFIENGMSVSEYTSTYGLSSAFEQFKKIFLMTPYSSDVKWNSTNDEGENIFSSEFNWQDITGTYKNSSTCDNTGFFLDTKGRIVSFDDAPAKNTNGPKLCIDVNGENKPNRYGVDYFIFMFTLDGNVIPWGQEHESNPGECGEVTNVTTCTIPRDKCQYSPTYSEQFACANYALLDEHPAKAGKTYFKDFTNGR
ncbi:MAG: type II secretion system GspH family protein, partial [Candidatus Gastranaerophilales bacterium]|nr:type II secretion system GspH family protein [Candidatus Gastranaerophilales bacterium]